MVSHPPTEARSLNSTGGWSSEGEATYLKLGFRPAAAPVVAKDGSFQVSAHERAQDGVLGVGAAYQSQHS